MLVDYFVVIELVTDTRDRSNTLYSDATSVTSTSDGQLPRYKPIVVDRYPLEDNHDHPLEPGTADFALPLDDRPVGVNDDRERAVYTFVLTNSARELTFGTTLRFYEPRTPQGDFMPKALCILSSHQWLTPFFESFLLNLHHLTTYRILTLHIEHYIQRFVDRVSLPPPGSLLRYESDATFVIIGQDGQAITSPTRSTRRLSLERSKNNEFLALDTLHINRAPDGTLPASVDSDFETLVSCLDFSNILLILNAIVLDSKLMFHSKDIGKLTSCLEALCALMLPFDWHHVYVPITPDHPDFLQMLNEDIIMPFMFGLHTDTYQKVSKTSTGLAEVFIVDLDRNEVECPESMEEPVVPFPRYLIIRTVASMKEIVPPSLIRKHIKVRSMHHHQQDDMNDNQKFGQTFAAQFRPRRQNEFVLDPHEVCRHAAIERLKEEKQNGGNKDIEKNGKGNNSNEDHKEKGGWRPWGKSKHHEKNQNENESEFKSEPETKTELEKDILTPPESENEQEPLDAEDGNNNPENLNAELQNMFSLWFTGRSMSTSTSPMKTASLHSTSNGTNSASTSVTSNDSVQKHLHPLSIGGSASTGSADQVCSWVDLFRCSVLEMFVVLLSNLNQHTVELRNGKKHVNVNTFVESIDHVPSRQFIDHLRCTQLWQQFCEMWEGNIPNPDLKLFHQAVDTYIEAREKKEEELQKKQQEKQKKGQEKERETSHTKTAACCLFNRSIYNNKEYLSHKNKWWYSLCHVRRSKNDMGEEALNATNATNSSGGRRRSTSRGNNAEIGTKRVGRPAATSFHVYADQMFPRLNRSLFITKQKDGNGGGGGGNGGGGGGSGSNGGERRASLVGGVLSRRNSSASRKGDDGREDLESTEVIPTLNGNNNGQQDSNFFSPRKRRVSMKAMTALRFSTTSSLMLASGNDVIEKGVNIRRVLSDRGAILSRRRQHHTPWRQTKFGRTMKDRKLEEDKMEDELTNSLFNDLKRLTETVGNDDTPYGKQDVRRRLVDELFEIRVGSTPHKY